MKIGIPTNLRDKRFGTHGNYIEWVAQFGQPVLLTPGIDQFDQFDALFLPGGKDVSSNLTFLNTPADPHLEWFDTMYISKCIVAKKPIFAVCRGMQALNVNLGGTLKNLYGDDLIHSNKSATELEKNTSHEYLYFKHDNLKFEIVSSHYVNSIHHQVIDKLAPKLIIAAKSSETDNIEAVIHENGLIAGVQYHPEKINDDFSKQLFNYILKQ